MPKYSKRNLPGPGFSFGREYIFGVDKDNKYVECEDIFIAASLLCHAARWENGQFTKEYKPGRFAGTSIGRVTETGRIVFIFRIEGNAAELWERKQLFHAGAHWVDPAELKRCRNFLMDALTEAKRQAKLHEKGLETDSTFQK